MQLHHVRQLRDGFTGGGVTVWSMSDSEETAPLHDLRCAHADSASDDLTVEDRQLVAAYARFPPDAELLRSAHHLATRTGPSW